METALTSSDTRISCGFSLGNWKFVSTQEVLNKCSSQQKCNINRLNSIIPVLVLDLLILKPELYDRTTKRLL
jgi:hypothetical protein